jgi:3-hydroxyisobutyryl-CoA hydrolase
VVNKTLPKWNPSTLEELDLERDIIVRYFIANANTRKLHFLNDQDYHLHPFRRYGLPSEREIFETVASEKLHSVKETVDWFVKNRNDKFGVRQKVEDAFNRLTFK